MKILSVDDDPIFLEIIRAELQSLGYSDVQQVTSGFDALKAVREAKTPFDCFLLDIDMPGMTGVELCAQLREEKRTRDVPIIMVTSRAELENVDRAFSAGATDYLNKPLNRRELRGRLTMAEEIKHQRAKASSGTQSAQESIRVEEAVRLDPSAGCIDFLAMQNFLLKLGSMEIFSRAVIAFNVSNIHQIFLTKDANGIRDTLCDVAELLIDALGSRPKLMSYAGSGNFVAVMTRVPVLETSQLFDNLSLSLEQLGDWYSAVGEIAPTLRIGEPVSRNLISFIAADEMLDLAIDRAIRSDVEVSYPPRMGALAKSAIG